MIYRVTIPQIFENMEEATIGEWLRNEGDAVTPGDALCELITEKTTFQLESESAGILRKILAPEKAVVPVGAVVAYIGELDDELPVEEAPVARAAEAAPAPDVVMPALHIPDIVSAPDAAAGANAGSRVRATPAARRAAKDRGITVEEVAAKFPGKVIGEDDVRAY